MTDFDLNWLGPYYISINGILLPIIRSLQPFLIYYRSKFNRGTQRWKSGIRHWLSFWFFACETFWGYFGKTFFSSLNWTTVAGYASCDQSIDVNIIKSWSSTISYCIQWLNASKSVGVVFDLLGITNGSFVRSSLSYPEQKRVFAWIRHLCNIQNRSSIYSTDIRW